MSDYVLDQLPNGARLVTVPMPHLHSVELVCYLAVGGRCETEELAGISHFLEHMIFRGTKDHATSTDLERAFEAIGGSVNASTDSETTCFHSRIHPDYLERGVALFASMLRTPQFQDIETERRIILEEAREDYNEQGVQINPDNLMVGLLWPGHALGRSLIGTPDSLERISMDDLRTYYQHWYQPQNLVVCACGAVDRDRTLASVVEQFGDWAPGAPLDDLSIPDLGPAESRSCWVQDSDSQVSVQLAFPLPGRSDASTLALRLLRRVLSWGGGAKLPLRLREELGLTYAVEANCSMLKDTGYLAIDLSVAPENLVRSVDELLQVVRELSQVPLSVEELSQFVESYCFDLDYSRDQTEALAVRYGWGVQADYLRTLEQDIAEMKLLTPDDLLAAAQRYLQTENARFVAVGPWSSEDRDQVEALLQLAG